MASSSPEVGLGPALSAKEEGDEVAAETRSEAQDSRREEDWPLFMTLEKTVWMACLLAERAESEELVSWPETVEMKSSDSFSPTRDRSGFTILRKWDICLRGRKPHSPSKGVIAMAISGLWLSSCGS